MSLRRREFLTISGSVIAGSAAIATPGWAGRPVSAESSPTRRGVGTLAIDYWPQSARIADLQGVASRLVEPKAREHWPTGLIPSQRLPAGDARLVDTGIELTIWGLTPSAEGLRPLRDASASIRFGAASGDVTFQAWAHSDGTVLNEGRVITFRVPIEREHGLELGISLDGFGSPGADLAHRLLGRLADGRRIDPALNAPIDPQPDWIRFAVEGHCDTPKLQRGIYLISRRDASSQKIGPQHLAISIEVANSSGGNSAPLPSAPIPKES